MSARVFAQMISRVRTCEEGIKRRVQKLRIQIGETNKSHQVAEITDSDYFQQLKTQVNELRRAGSDAEWRASQGVSALVMAK